MSEFSHDEELELVEIPIVKKLRMTDISTAFISEDGVFAEVRYLIVYTNDGDKHCYAMTPAQATALGKQI